MAKKAKGVEVDSMVSDGVEVAESVESKLDSVVEKIAKKVGSKKPEKTEVVKRKSDEERAIESLENEAIKNYRDIIKVVAGGKDIAINGSVVGLDIRYNRMIVQTAVYMNGMRSYRTQEVILG